MLEKKYITILQSTPWLSAMTVTLQNAFLEEMKVVHLRKGSNLYRKGDEGTAFHCVLAGAVDISNVHTDGKKMILAQLSVGSWFGEISMFDGKGRTHDTDAASDISLALIARSDFHRLLSEYPICYQYFNSLLCQKIRATFSVLDHSVSLSLKQQLARRLLLLSTNFGQSASLAKCEDVTASQESLAMMINSSRQTVNKLLKEMEQSGFLRTQYRKVRLLNIPSLKIMCDWEQ